MASSPCCSTRATICGRSRRPRWLAGADALGMAGGDGSQAVVAAVAAAHGLPFVCVPAGTRNHLALDLGIDRDEPAACPRRLRSGPRDHHRPGRGERRGLRQQRVARPLRADRGVRPITGRPSAGRWPRCCRTWWGRTPNLSGSPSTVRTDPSPTRNSIQVSNNPYTLSSVTGFGSRPRLDTGALGVATLTINRTSDVSRLVALEAAGHPERYEGWRQWTVTDLEVRGTPSLAAAMDGEAHTWKPPLFVRDPSGGAPGSYRHGRAGCLASLPPRARTGVDLGRTRPSDAWTTEWDRGQSDGARHMSAIGRTGESPKGSESRRTAGDVACQLVEDANSLDHAIYDAIANTPTPTLDVAMGCISNAANLLSDLDRDRRYSRGGRRQPRSTRCHSRSDRGRRYVDRSELGRQAPLLQEPARSVSCCRKA